MTQNRVTKLHVVGITLLATWGLDFLTKFWVAARMRAALDGSGEPVPAAFLVYRRNSGAVFGWMSDWSDPVRTAVFVGVAALLVWLGVSIYRRLGAGEKLNAFALGLVVGGGMGNLMDRLRLGGSQDIFQLPDWPVYAGSGPTTNMADVFIVVGVAILLLELLVSEGVTRAKGSSPLSEEPPGVPKSAPGPAREPGEDKKNTSPYAD